MKKEKFVVVLFHLPPDPVNYPTGLEKFKAATEFSTIGKVFTGRPRAMAALRYYKRTTPHALFRLVKIP